MDRSEPGSHWERVYETKAASELSWYQKQPERSVQLIRLTGAGPSSRIIDVGGGDSALVDALLDDGIHHVTVLDLSGVALERARKRLGGRASSVTWIQEDVTRAQLDDSAYDVWHDRAVFHFLTREDDRRRYVDVVRHTVKIGGHVLVATFAEDGPTRCSGLDVVRYSADSLHAEFGSEFELAEKTDEIHRTPWGADQHFVYCLCKRR